MLEVAVVALPLTNLWLLGRRPERTPLLRVQAPIRSLQRAGVLVALGGDNVQDPWYPGGDFDPIELLRLSPLTSHLWPAQRQGLAPFSTAPARLLGLEWDGLVREGVLRIWCCWPPATGPTCWPAAPSGWCCAAGAGCRRRRCSNPRPCCRTSAWPEPIGRHAAHPSDATIDALASRAAVPTILLALVTAAEAADLERLSRDYFDYSPVLVPRFSGQRAQLAVRARAVEQVRWWLEPAPATACPSPCAVPAPATTASACPWPAGWCWISPACSGCATWSRPVA
jgi:hypothetical protein